MFSLLSRFKVQRPKRHWSDDDRHYGPLLISKQEVSYRPIAFLLNTGHNDRPSAHVRVSGFGYTFILELPQFSGGNKEYGFSVNRGYLRLYYGGNDDSMLERGKKSYFLPWHDWRVTSVIPYIHDGKSEVVYTLRDYDNTVIQATVSLTDYIYKRGCNKWKWLSYFCKDRHTRRAEIKFSEETGRGKGSWKGGTLGTSYSVEMYDTPQSVIEQYCKKKNMTLY